MFKSALLDELPVPVFYKDKDGKYLGCNSAFERFLGKSESEIVGKGVYELSPKEIADEYFRKDKEILEKGGTQVYEWLVRTAGGETRTVEFHKALFRDAQGDVGGIVGTVIDVTERKKAEAALRQSEERSRTMLEASFEIIFVIDRDDCVQYANPAGLRVLGKSASEVVGKPRSSLFPPEMSAHQKASLDQVFSSGAPLFQENPAATLGSVGWQETLLVPLKDSRGEVNSVMGISRDITERKRAENQLRQSENKYRALVETTGTGFLILDEHGRVIDANQEYIRLTGRDKLEEILGRSVVEWTADHEKLKNAREVTKCLKEGFVRNLCVDYIDRRGSITPVEINATTQTEGNTVRIISLCRDISDRKRAQREQEELRVQLIQASKLASLGTLAAGVAHEINNPLAIVKGNLALLKKRITAVPTESRAEFGTDALAMLERQNGAVDRIAKIVDGLLTFARTDGEVVQSVDAHQAVVDTMALCVSLFKGSNFRIETDLGSRRSFVTANFGKLQQVFLNLLSNAKDATEGVRSGGLVKIQTLEHGDDLLITFSDNGAGIDKLDLHRIFDPFFTTKPPGKGTGLGLSISNSIIKAFGGTLSVVSEVGLGTCIEIRLPLSSDSQGIDQTVTAVASARLSGRALLVDDEQDLLEVLKGYLFETGLEVVTATDGDEALEVLKKERFDFVITDLKMPRVSGEKVLSEARKFPHLDGAFFIVITGGILTDYSKEQRELVGSLAHAFLRKPFDQEEVVRVMQSLAGNRARRSGRD